MEGRNGKGGGEKKTEKKKKEGKMLGKLHSER